MEKFESRFPKIITRTPEEKKEIKERLEKDYLEFRKEIAPLEIPEDERDCYLPKIKDLETATRKIIEKYKGRREKPFPMERVASSGRMA
ncbi:hypothetical protein KKH59_01390 [Patescibacteria group bacterium]|nr:hypothetical protein [Patescibacteria group bacterium]